MIPAQLLEDLKREVSPTTADVRAREIPLRKRAPRLHRIIAPAHKLLARLLPLCRVELIELREERRQIRISRMSLDVVLEKLSPASGVWDCRCTSAIAKSVASKTGRVAPSGLFKIDS
jgi:hypothetical protein